MSLIERTPPEAENDADAEPEPRRLFIHEPGWLVHLKVGSIRENCYQIAPGQDYYHRIADGEMYIIRADEKLCLACAARRGILSYEVKRMRESISSFEFTASKDLVSDFELGPLPND